MKYGAFLPLQPLDTDITLWLPGYLNAAVGCAYQCDRYPALEVSTFTWVGLFPFGCEAAR